MPYTLSAVAELAVKYVNTTQRNVFLTGKAGSGKTTLLKHIINNTYKNAVVAAPTGIAAINAGGVTLHSLLQLPFGTFIPEDIPYNFEIREKVNTPHSVISQLQMSAPKRALLKEIELLIIDEVSMLRADLLDCIDVILRHVRRRKNDPFGGVQLLFIGDLNQLPPVVKRSEWPLLSQFYSSAYFFDSFALKEAPPVFVELDKIYRQSDQEFIEILNRLRDNRLLDEDRDRLNSHYVKDFSPTNKEGYIHITTHIRKSDVINKKEIDKLNTTTFKYSAIITGDFPENMFPIPEVLTLKEGAQVMFIKNDPSGEGQFYNGKIGNVINLSDEHIDVLLNDSNKIVKVQTYLWENKRYKVNPTSNEVEENIIGSFEQYPLKLAWAITVHKSQGLTFEKAILDLTDSFAPGQMYVALSRLTALKGLVLSTPIPSSGVEIDAALSEFARTKKTYDSLTQELSNDRKEFILTYTQKAFDFSSLLTDLSNHLKSFNKDEKRSMKQQHHSWTLGLFKETTDLQEISEKFIRQLRNIQYQSPTEYLQPILERVTKAEEYFIPLINILLDKIKKQKSTLGKQPQVKTYSNELKEIIALYKKQVHQIRKARMLIAYASEDKIPEKKTLYSKIIENDKDKKSPTREITLALYNQGMDIQEIALERGLSYTTIEGHLASHVENGVLEVSKFLNEEKIKHIQAVVETLKTTKLNEIKQKLGDEFTYCDIKMALAHNKYLQSIIEKE